MIAIINYGMGNLGSVQNALTFLGLESQIVEDPDQLMTYDKAILPGVGAFGQAMQNLNAKGQSQAIRDYVAKGKPLIGICLGMQLLLESSCELGEYEGLGLVKGHVRSLKDKVQKLPIPHVGWNTVAAGCPSKVFNNDPSLEPAFYFVHSFYCDVQDKSVVAGTTNYEFQIDVCVEQENLFGCQFHPEKSQKHGLQILKRFGEL